jgi:hypothetical protein
MRSWNSRTGLQKVATVAFIVLWAGLMFVRFYRPETTLAIANRTDAVVAVGPGVVVPACSTETFSIEQFEQARIDERQTGWKAPVGSVLFTSLPFELVGEWSGPATLVVSSTALPEFWPVTVDDGDLPECQGQPWDGLEIVD